MGINLLTNTQIKNAIYLKYFLHSFLCTADSSFLLLLECISFAYWDLMHEESWKKIFFLNEIVFSSFLHDISIYLSYLYLTSPFHFIFAYLFNFSFCCWTSESMKKNCSFPFFFLQHKNSNSPRHCHWKKVSYEGREEKKMRVAYSHLSLFYP